MERKKILLVEDSRDVQILVHSILAKKFDLKTIGNAQDALSELSAVRYSLILLDVGLPDEDGFKFCAKLKVSENLKSIPVIFLTGKNESSDKVFGFSLGADDYIVKPFDPFEFEARIEAKMRKLNEKHETEVIFADGDYKVNLAFQKIYRMKNGEAIDLGLTTIEFKILFYFLTHQDHVLSRTELLETIGRGPAIVSDRTIDTHIYTLRQKMGSDAVCIQSVPRVGYKFSAVNPLRQEIIL